MKDNKKDKILYGIIITLVVVIVVGGVFLLMRDSDNTNSNTSNNDSVFPDFDEIEPDTRVLDAHVESGNVLDEERKPVVYITVEEYLDLRAASEASIIYIGRPTCPFCNIARPIIEHVAFLHNLTIHYIDTDELTSSERIDLQASDESFRNGIGTPLLLVVRNGRIVDQFPGLTSIEGYTDFFKGNNLIS